MNRSTLLALTIALSSLAFAAKDKPQIRYMQDVLNHATPEEKKDLTKVLDQIDVVPLNTKFKGQPVFRVKYVQKNSPFERAGFENGDLVVNGSSPTTQSVVK